MASPSVDVEPRGETSTASGMPSCSAVGVEQLEDVLVDRRAARDRRAAAHEDLALVVGITAAHIGRVRDVDRHGDVRLDGERGRARAGEVADLLHHRGHRDHVAGRAAGFGDPPRGLERDVTAHPVVERARDDAVALQREWRAVPDDVVAGTDETPQLVAVLRADVEDEIVALDRLAVGAGFPLLLLLGDHAGNGAVPREDVDALADHHGGVPAAPRSHRGEPVVAEIRDDDGDLVDVADERERRAVRRARHTHPRVAQRIGGNLADGGSSLPPDGGGRALLSGGTGRRQQAFEQLGKRHGATLPAPVCVTPR